MSTIMTQITEIVHSTAGLGTSLSGVMEGMGVPWPGAIVITAAGAEFRGFASASLLGTLFSITYTIGALIQYACGRCFRTLLERLLSPKLRSRLDKMMAKYGQAAVLWTRPLAIGNYISIPAGMMRMDPAKFTLYTFIGIWPWAFSMALAGAVLGQYTSIATTATHYLIAATIAWGLVAGAVKLYRYTKARQAS